MAIIFPGTQVGRKAHAEQARQAQREGQAPPPGRMKECKLARS